VKGRRCGGKGSRHAPETSQSRIDITTDVFRSNQCGIHCRHNLDTVLLMIHSPGLTRIAGVHEWRDRNSAGWMRCPHHPKEDRCQVGHISALTLL
jgi:hypothetical protein